jgi:hypothetical protein
MLAREPKMLVAVALANRMGNVAQGRGFPYLVPLALMG